MTRQDDPRVDDLRKQLRALGYLDAGVDRFVLGPARSARSPWSIAGLSSLRVGLIAAALLGPAAAIGIRTRLPGLVTSTQDAAVITVYLAALFGVGATVFSFVASMLVGRLAVTADAARARLLSRATGTVVAVACLAYLTLWWHSANAHLSWTAPAWTVVALVVAVLISLLLGHAVSITTFAVIASRHPLAPARATATSSTRLVLVAGVIAFAGAAALLGAASQREPAAAEAPPLAVVSPGVRLRVIAIDGFDPDVFASLRDQGRMPALARVFSHSAVRVPIEDGQDPARTWTTIATGQPASVHGVESLETRRVAGVQGSVASGEQGSAARALRTATDSLRLTRPSVASGSQRRAKTFWEVAADAGLRAVVVNWWATWPASDSGRTPPAIVSDRAALRLERGGTLNAEIAPAALYEQFQKDWPLLKKHVGTQLQRLLPTHADEAIDRVLRRSAELDALHLALWQRFYGQSTALDLMTLYLPGLDIVQHSLLAPADAATPAALSARLEALRDYYVFLDRLLADPTAVPPDSTRELLVVITQPGRRPGSYGTIGFVGAMSSSQSAGEMRPVDIAPTLLYALGVPISRELAGRPRVEVFATDFVSRFPVRDVSTYGDPNVSRAGAQGQPLDEEMVERLRSLGYVR